MSSSKQKQIEGAPTLARPPLPLWRNRDYMILWTGQMISETGSQVSQLAFPFSLA